MIGKKTKASKRKNYCLIGFNEFNCEIGRMLTKEGIDVTLIDKDQEIVDKLAGEFFKVANIDATQERALEELSIKEFDYVIVGIDNIETSISICSGLKELEVTKIFAKARNQVHRRILKLMGVVHSMVPELYVTEKIFYQTLHDIEVDRLPFEWEEAKESKLFSVRLRVRNPNLDEEKVSSILPTLTELGSSIVGIKRIKDGEVVSPVTPEHKLFSFDTVMIVAKIESISELKQLFLTGKPIECPPESASEEIEDKED